MLGGDGILLYRFVYISLKASVFARRLVVRCGKR